MSSIRRTKPSRAMENFFKESTLVALREMALRQTAQEVEERLEQSDAGLPAASSNGQPGTAHTHDAVVIYISDDPSTAMLIRRGKRVADVTHADCFAVFVAEQSDLEIITGSQARSCGAPPEFCPQPAY